jgi:hypothetical protein
MVAASPSPVLNAAPLRFELAHGITIGAYAYGNRGDRRVIFPHRGGRTRHTRGGAAERLEASARDIFIEAVSDFIRRNFGS